MVLFTEQEIQERVKSLGIQVSYQANPEGKPRVMIGVLNGAFMFFSDLVRNMEVDCEIDFIQVKSYQNQQQFDIKLLKDINVEIAGKDVYVVDDIFDSGNTMRYLITHLQTRKPKSITPVTLFKSNYSYMENLIYGFELAEEYWIRGYGLDNVDGTKRNLRHVEGTIFE